MRILFYSASPSRFDSSKVQSVILPSWGEQWDSLARAHPEHEFIIASQPSGMFLPDISEDTADGGKAHILHKIIKNDKEADIAEELSALRPDMAVALSSYSPPYDWFPIKDAMIADFLRDKGIKTICHPVETGLICFDKWRAHEFFSRAGAPRAEALYLHHELFINAGNRRELKSNVFSDSLLHQMRRMRFPLIIKDTTGLSSLGADVVKSFDEAAGVLRSKKTTSDRIIEEMICGEHFGTEIYGSGGNYDILPPFMMSVNKYGITSPKQSLKAGPLPTGSEESESRYRLSELRDTLLHLARELRLDGIAQTDLVFDGEKWFVIEVNPRLSGMSPAYAASAGIPLGEMVFKKLIGPGKPEDIKFSPTLSIKFPVLERGLLYKLKSLPYVGFVGQIENKGARQIRERGYCEVILTGETKERLKENTMDMLEKFPALSRKDFFDTAAGMLGRL